MKLWLDDERVAPEGWLRCFNVNTVIYFLAKYGDDVDEISLDHDMGEYAQYGGDGIKVLDWMAEHDVWPEKVHVHTGNPPARDQMLALIDRYKPKEDR